MHELRKIVLRLGTSSGMTTTGVEHVHNLQQWLFDGRRGSMQATTENDEMKLVSDIRTDDVDVIVDCAQCVWSELYGAPRAHDLTQPTATQGKRGSRPDKPCQHQCIISVVGFAIVILFKVSRHALLVVLAQRTTATQEVHTI